MFTLPIAVLDWLNLDKLSLNINKTKAMLFYTTLCSHSIEFPDININDTKLEWSQKFIS